MTTRADPVGRPRRVASAELRLVDGARHQADSPRPTNVGNLTVEEAGRKPWLAA